MASQKNTAIHCMWPATLNSVSTLEQDQVHLCPRGVCALPLASQAGVDPAVDLKFRFTVLGVASAMASCPISAVITIGAICHSCGTGLPITLCPPAPDVAVEIECQSTPNNQLTTTPSNNDSARLEDQR